MATGIAHRQTLILPDSFPTAGRWKKVGTLVRRECAKLIVGYRFDLRTNSLMPETVANPGEGREHVFHAWRETRTSGDDRVAMRPERASAEERDAAP